MAGKSEPFPLMGLRLTDRSVAVPLKDIEVKVTVKGCIADVESTLLYENSEDKAVEAEFVFPVDDKSAVYKFEAEIDGRTIVAECQDRDVAKETYKDAISSGHTAMMLSEDQSSGDIFEMKIGNLPSKKEAKLTFCYVIELTLEPEGIVSFTLPTVLNPRYQPQDGPDSLSNRGNALHYSDCEYNFKFTAAIVGQQIIKSVTSTKDKLNITMETDKKSATVVLVDKFMFDHDLCLDIEYEDLSKPTVIVERGIPDGPGMLQSNVLMLNFSPKFQATSEQAKGEFIFVIDRSGSMGGDRIKKASETLLLLLKSLPVGCTFNIISFGSNHELLFERPEVYNDTSLKEALNLQKAIDADMGGTEILQPLKSVFQSKSTTLRQLFLLTDGAVSNTDEVISLCKKHSGNTRVFSFGIGSGASTSLIKNVAKVTNGKATFIKDTERLHGKVMSVLKCALQPGVRNVELEWNLPKDVTVLTMPSEVPTVFQGEQLILYGIVNEFKEGSGKSSLTLKGIAESNKISHTVNFDLCEVNHLPDSSAPIHRLAAKSQIKHLELESGDYGNPHKEQITLVSVAANVVSKYTAFVGVDKESKVLVDGKFPRDFEECVEVYNLMACGLDCSASNSVDSYRCMSANLSMSAAPFSASSVKRKFSMPSFFGGLKQLFSKSDSTSKKSYYNSAPRKSKSRHSSSAVMKCSSKESHVEYDDTGCDYLSSDKSDKMMNLVDLQQFNGSWNLTKELTEIFGKTLKHFQDTNVCKNEDLWATLLAIAYLRLKFMDRKDEWEMIEQKAKSWIKQQNLQGKKEEELIEEAKTALSG